MNKRIKHFPFGAIYLPDFVNVSLPKTGVALGKAKEINLGSFTEMKRLTQKDVLALKIITGKGNGLDDLLNFFLKTDRNLLVGINKKNPAFFGFGKGKISLGRKVIPQMALKNLGLFLFGNGDGFVLRIVVNND